MKLRRFLSGVLFGAGCAVSFIALLAIVLPQIDNPQLQLVLASFELASDHPVISGFHSFASFAIQQNWRMLYLGLMVLAAGAGLLLHFSPAKSKASDSAPVSEASPKACAATEKPNPYANVRYQEPEPLTPAPDDLKEAFRARPILEKNRIEEAEEDTAQESAPYFSPRFAQETQAIETDSGLESQSGSRLLIRNAYTPPAPSEPPVHEEPKPLITPERKPSSTFAPPPPVSAPSGRIRSTMGRHSARNTKFPHTSS